MMLSDLKYSVVKIYKNYRSDEVNQIKYSSIQVQSLQIGYNTHTNLSIINNVKSRDPIGSKNRNI